ncbi:rhodanese-like domain-containing protein [Enterococcus wangshanyuanii]|uniref:Sulfurtransferase n=1 Tax=Enterococcus wangshanyuanii TaxID=2005703 RepID=A0ABQ1NGV5_9ENTE|nr:rhodanese-like domain-containing protein [Enterococcus wangshanyuanii]GGC76800.1 sulfurtransferase [Enterococcus wangshanyuanii]
MFSFFNKTSIDLSELQQKLDMKSEIIDVREKSKFQAGHIPGAKNIPLSKIGSYSLKSEQPIYVICQSGLRSRQATKILRKKGIQAFNVKGGMSRWSGAVRGGKL